jgi:hypothetical protein
MITAIVAIAFIILLSVLGGSIYLNYKLGKTMLIIQDKIEISLDELDQIYGRISKILDIPVFFDSVEVRQVIADIDNARNVVLKIADSLSNVTKDEDDTQEEN